MDQFVAISPTLLILIMLVKRTGSVRLTFGWASRR